MKSKFEALFTKELLEEQKALGLYQWQIAEKFGVSVDTVRKFCRIHDVDLQGIERHKQKMINDNPCKKQEVREKISQTVKEKWHQGYYEDRINGMLGKTGLDAPNFMPENHYRAKYLFYTDKKCAICGATDKKLNIHHVDEDRKNNSLSNLVCLCVHCHQKFHYKIYKQGYCTLTKMFEFEASHELPEYDGPCNFLHGHSYKLYVSVRRRINPDTGMVMDFKELKEIVNREVISVFDHGYLNDTIWNPTCENQLYWIWERLSPFIWGLEKIELFETSGSSAYITREDVKKAVQELKIETEWLEKEEKEDGFDKE